MYVKPANIVTTALVPRLPRQKKTQTNQNGVACISDSMSRTLQRKTWMRTNKSLMKTADWGGRVLGHSLNFTSPKKELYSKYKLTFKINIKIKVSNALFIREQSVQEVEARSSISLANVWQF